MKKLKVKWNHKYGKKQEVLLFKQLIKKTLFSLHAPPDHSVGGSYSAPPPGCSLTDAHRVITSPS